MSETEVNTDKLISDLKAVARDTEDLLKATADQAGEKAAELRERLNSALGSARSACERLENRALAGAETTDRKIREHPYESIGIAFGVGLLLGVILGRR
ncbi:MAG: DUF883 domain-containing protein [Verrucomicrobiales bacterium]|nr:DUF883 domain-containing protein [Verrucomicrobiales bacterium]MCP5525595.1 DUF883 domain-containing protein [Verrucomicrobiales bacterium]